MCGGFVGDTLASIDPGPAISDIGTSIDENITQPVSGGLADVDKFVNNEVPGGWVLPAALAVAYATGYIDPSLFATEAAATAAAEAGAGAIATEAGQAAFFEALAAGATSAEAVSAGLGVEALAAGTAGFVTPELMGPTYGELGLTGVEGGLAGPTYAEMGYTGLNGAEAVAAADAAAYAAQNNITLKDAYNALSKANAVKNLAMSGYNLVTGQGVPKTGGGFNLLNYGGNDQLTGDTTDVGTGSGLEGDLTTANTNFTLNDFGAGATATPQLFNTGTNPAAYAPTASQSFVPTQSVPTQSFNEGGGVEGHNPTFFSPGGLASMENTYVKGEGDGTSDSVAAMLANGEFVIPADVVSKLGNGSNDAGANVLDEFLSTIREHAQKHNPKDLPPDSKGPLAYLAEANKKAIA
jgi:hypothetical protein